MRRTTWLAPLTADTLGPVAGDFTNRQDSGDKGGRKLPASFLVALCSLLTLGPALHAQTAPVVQEQLRRIEAEKPRDPLYSQWRAREELAQTTFDWGGWSSYSLLTFDDDDNSSATPDAIQDLFISDQRIWAKAEFENGNSLYGRVRYLNYELSLAPGTARPFFANERLDLDLLYYDFTLWDDHQVRLGRQYLRQGRGLTLNGNYDGAHVGWGGDGWSYSSFLVKNPPNELDIDPLVSKSPNPLTSAQPRRFFGGLNISYLAEDGKRYFGYFLGERDDSQTPAALLAAGQSLEYDANYFAIGSEGDFDLDVSYYLELIAQKGDAIAIGSTTGRVDLDGRAGIGEIAYHPEWKGHPAFTAEYAFASGDPTRLPGLNTLSAAAAGGENRNFTGFGRFDGGLALNPRLSNLNVLSFGASWRPWEEYHFPGTVTLGAKYRMYRKDDAAGGISDLQATLADDDVGSAIDLYLGWRPFSDLSVIAQYGIFSPGDAYPVATRDDAQNLYVNVTYAF